MDTWTDGGGQKRAPPTQGILFAAFQLCSPSNPDLSNTFLKTPSLDTLPSQPYRLLRRWYPLNSTQCSPETLRYVLILGPGLSQIQLLAFPAPHHLSRFMDSNYVKAQFFNRHFVANLAPPKGRCSACSPRQLRAHLCQRTRAHPEHPVRHLQAHQVRRQVHRHPHPR